SPLPNGVVEDLQKVDGVAAVSPIRFETGKLVSDNKNLGVTGVDPRTVAQALSLEWKQGSNQVLSGLTPDQAVVSQDWADSHDVKVGDDISLITPRGKKVTYTIAGT